MISYQQLLFHVMTYGKDRSDRTGVGTRSVFGYQWRHSMGAGFPLLTTKKVHFRSVLVELLWFLRGDTNIKFLKDHGVSIWDEWADENGELGPVYGKQWRCWESPDGRALDQISQLVKDLKSNPHSRRHVVSAWNVADVGRMKLPPCHTLWQCYVEEGGADRINTLHLHLYARSIDSFLGLPFNIASYALLLSILAREVGMVAGDLIISFGDLHIYKNHFEQVRTQLERRTLRLPKLEINAGPEVGLFDLRPEHFDLVGYTHHPAIKAPVAV